LFLLEKDILPILNFIRHVHGKRVYGFTHADDGYPIDFFVEGGDLTANSKIAPKYPMKKPWQSPFICNNLTSI
jgi:hypothetical protein